MADGNPGHSRRPTDAIYPQRDADGPEEGAGRDERPLDLREAAKADRGRRLASEVSAIARGTTPDNSRCSRRAIGRRSQLVSTGAFARPNAERRDERGAGERSDHVAC